MKLRNNYYLRNKDTGYVISFTTRKEQMIFYNELNGWEVVDIVTKSNEGATAEPLIKDEKIREIIRLWTKVNGVVGLTYNAPENSLTDIFRNEISFNGCLGLDDGCFYTANELCGEEEK